MAGLKSRITLADLSDGYTVLMTNSSHTFAGGVSAALESSITTQIVALRGGVLVSASVGTITGMPTGMQATIVDNNTTSAKITISVSTSMTSRQGVVTIPVTVGGTLFNLDFSYALALVGAKGAKGATGATGATGKTGSTGSTGATGGTGASGSRAIRYLGKSATVGAGVTNKNPTDLATSINGDWFLNTNDGYVYYKTAATPTWAKITSATDYRLLSCVDDMIVLHQTVTANTTLNTAVNNYITALATGTLLAQKIFTNSIKLTGDFKIFTSDNELIANFDNYGSANLSKVICDMLSSGEGGIGAKVVFDDTQSESSLNHYKGQITVGSTETGENSRISIFHSFIQAHLHNGNKTVLQLQKLGGGLTIGDSVNNFGNTNEVRSYLPMFIRGADGSDPLGDWAKVLGVKASSLDLSNNKNKGTWASGQAYAVGDVVFGTNISNSTYGIWRCKTAHTSSSSIKLTTAAISNVTYWESATDTGYIVFSNGLKIQWVKYCDGFNNASVKDNLYFPLPYISPASCIIIGYYDNSSGTMAKSDVGARLYGNNTQRFKAITGGGMYSFFAIGY